MARIITLLPTPLTPYETPEGTKGGGRSEGGRGREEGGE